MPVAPVDENGTQIYFEDSGAPLSDTYTTVVLVHATAFHGGRPAYSSVSSTFGSLVDFVCFYQVYSNAYSRSLANPICVWFR